MAEVIPSKYTLENLFKLNRTWQRYSDSLSPTAIRESTPFGVGYLLARAFTIEEATALVEVWEAAR